MPVFSFTRMSCFGPGTPVKTLSGIGTVEAVRVDDRVPTQDLKTGALRYQPILTIFHNPPSRRFEVDFGGETIVSSPFHRLWTAGRGRAMAGDLAVGDTLRLLDGLVKADAIRDRRIEPVFNLDVAGDADFFVGKGGALVHDNTLPDLRLAPFDAPPHLGTASATESTARK